MKITPDTLPQLEVPVDLGWSDWLLMEQERIDAFAEVTDDHQWIHVDRERAHRESPLGGTIAHGFLILSLVTRLFLERANFAGFSVLTNYGLDKVRFVRPVPAGAEIRLGSELLSIRQRKQGFFLRLRGQMQVRQAGEEKGQRAAVVEMLFLASAA